MKQMGPGAPRRWRLGLVNEPPFVHRWCVLEEGRRFEVADTHRYFFVIL